jgi:Domain of unknown function (DUF4214)
MRYALFVVAATLVVIGLTSSEVEATVRRRVTPEDIRLVSAWYQKYLGRDVDAVGIQCWTQELRRGGNAEAGILGSAEYLARHGSSAEGFVVGLYVEVLGRDPAFHEVQVWICRLQNLGCNRVRLAEEFLRAATSEIAQRACSPAPPVIYQPGYPPPGTLMPIPQSGFQPPLR